jgi:ParB family chromosome partitioning protein
VTVTEEETRPAEFELLMVDPGTLVFAANVRDARPDKGLVASIRERGVLTPVAAYRNAAGELVVLRGRRRTLAAVEAGRSTVPVLVEPEPFDSERVIDQIGENDHRLGLSTADRAAAYEQLAGFGLTAAQIAKQTGTRRADVDAGLKVAASRAAQKAMQRAPLTLTLDEAAVVAEFEDDKDAVAQLVDAARSGQFAHEAQRLRDRRAEAEAKAEAMQALLDAGVTVVDPIDHRTTFRISELVDAKTGKALTPGRHARCPGHAATVASSYAAGARLAFRPVYVCVDYAEHGHVRSWEYGRTGRAKAATEQEREAERVERREVIAGNKAWDSAQTVRRTWLRTFLARKAAPKDAGVFVAVTLVDRGDWTLRFVLERGHTLAHELYGLGEAPAYGEPDRLAAMLDGASTDRALMVALGVVLAAQEQAISRNTWRSTSPVTARYLRYLQTNGYTLSDIERRACGEQPDPVDVSTEATP